MTDPDWRPAHAYVPGRTARHAEGLFDRFKCVSQPLEMSLAWRAGLAFYRAGFFWEAHEVWEALWLAAPQNSAERCVIRAAIQCANAGLKRRMRVAKAADRIDRMARADLAEGFARARGRVMGMTREDFEEWLAL